ncbi:ABC transporter permease [Glutamicibacter halophytocola]|uniref:ABC transporter permease n=1 Tax=Glutamicibacter halophytocola TaxID=1933880 RepID=A0ABX5Y4H5_9MICC|nr:ABC transporter permease [Glutamicibacter halophytocola]NQD42620.1 ABC transporter permease [Glutamicibacter halophytocola]QDY65005.1 ABC transporter permease [Glutamicibacter halophytocola]
MNSLLRLFTGFVAALLEAWQELRIHKLRVLLSLVGVTIAVASLTTAVAGAGMAQQLMTEQLERNGRPALINTYAFSEQGEQFPSANAQVANAFTKTAERFDVEYASMVSRTYGYKASAQGASIDAEVMVVDPDYAPIHRIFAQHGRWLESEDAQNLAPTVVVDRTLYQELELDQGPLPASIEMNAGAQKVSVTVIGATSTRDGGLGGQMWMLPQTYDHWFAATSPLADASYEMWVPIEGSEELAAHFAVQMQAELPGYSVESMRSDYLSWGGDESLQQLAMVAGGIAGIILLLGSLSLLNVAMVTMKQRIREVGIRRSFGATTGRVFFSVMMESVVATAVAGGLGVLISVAVVTNPKVINMIVGSGIDQMPAFPIGAALAGIAVSIAVGALTGVLPALVAARVRIVDAIRV